MARDPARGPGTTSLHGLAVHRVGGAFLQHGLRTSWKVKRLFNVGDEETGGVVAWPRF